jgi:iron complex outermembrane receptor protein
MSNRVEFAGVRCIGAQLRAPRELFPAAVLLAAVSLSVPAIAQDVGDAEQASRRGATAVLMEEVTVTARKREEQEQEVPISISAYSGAQIEALKVRDLRSLTVAMPNVAMDDIATTRGVANFSIRGLGINSSIPGIDPTVGVFLDGVYQAQNAGVVLDLYDVASIEVLRGPQGTLFGRNVTGGAVLINTKRPGKEFELSLQSAVDGNSNGDGGTTYYVMGAVGGPIGDSFAARLGVYYNEDDGWFTNLATGQDFGEASTTIYRPSFVWTPTDSVSIDVRWEHMESDGDGPASQTHTNGSGVPGAFVNFPRDSYQFAIDETGFIDLELDMASARLDWDVGEGTITNILGYRDYYATTYGDIDAQPVWLFHASSINDQEQWSNELRYNVDTGSANVTVGLYYLDNEIKYSEGRDLLGVALVGTPLEGNPALTQYGGGILQLESKAAFASIDLSVSDDWIINAGVRYTIEDKSAQVATLTNPSNVNNPCSITPSPFAGVNRICSFDFVDSNQWNDWSGKLGFTHYISNDKRIYGYWAQSHRSGGYNLRNTSLDPNFGPGPFDQETATTVELGYKSEPWDRGYFNVALFYTTIDDMQREVNQSSPISGVVQIIRNTADAQIPGFEVEGLWALGDNTALMASVGYVDPNYVFVRFDLNGDGVVDARDKALKLPRAAEWTYFVGLNHDWLFSGGSTLSARASYSYRDDAFYTDNNLGYFLDQNVVDAGVDYTTANGQWVFSVYGKNLTDSVNHGGDTQLPTFLGPVPAGGTFSPLLKGRVVGLQLTFQMNP